MGDIALVTGGPGRRPDIGPVTRPRTVRTGLGAVALLAGVGGLGTGTAELTVGDLISLLLLSVVGAAIPSALDLTGRRFGRMLLAGFPTVTAAAVVAPPAATHGTTPRSPGPDNLDEMSKVRSC